jgi:bifunctional oligoribonuclease and PAP phosphatase NrnA
MMRYGVEDWDRAVDALRKATSIAIACHVNPDGDALGSLLGADLGLKKLNKKTSPALEGGTQGVPPAYKFLPGVDALIEPKDIGDFDLFLALDCGAGDRLGDLQELASSAPVSINVDHHPGNDMFGTLNIVVTDASSTAELVTRLLLDAGVAIDRDIATCLYVGLVTDTGRFQYSNTTPETLRIAADLLEFGVPATQIAQEVFESSPFGYLKLVGRVLERARLFEDEGFVYSWVTLADLDESGVGMDETENLVDAVRSTRAADVAAMFKQLPDGSYRVSLRSKGPRSVGAVARELGGGGHELAAGFTAEDIEKTVEAIRHALATT